MKNARLYFDRNDPLKPGWWLRFEWWGIDMGIEIGAPVDANLQLLAYHLTGVFHQRDSGRVAVWSSSQSEPVEQLGWITVCNGIVTEWSAS